MLEVALEVDWLDDVAPPLDAELVIDVPPLPPWPPEPLLEAEELPVELDALVEPLEASLLVALVALVVLVVLVAVVVPDVALLEVTLDELEAELDEPTLAVDVSQGPLQVRMQVPAGQLQVPLIGVPPVVQSLPHEPQCWTVWRSTSQPSNWFWLQSAKPDAQPLYAH